MEQNRIAVVGVIVENPDVTEELNRILHEYRDCIIGRMGVPYPKRKLGIISVALDAPQNAISALSGKLGMLDGVSVKTIYSKQEIPAETR